MKQTLEELKECINDFVTIGWNNYEKPPEQQYDIRIRGLEDVLERLERLGESEDNPIILLNIKEIKKYCENELIENIKIYLRGKNKGQIGLEEIDAFRNAKVGHRMVLYKKIEELLNIVSN